jgi:hypothetical protein
MKVIATSPGFYGGHRRRAGTEFDMADADIVRDPAGAILSPRWVVPATPDNARKFADAKAADSAREMRAAIVSSGTRFAKAKEQRYRDAIAGQVDD